MEENQENQQEKEEVNANDELAYIKKQWLYKTIVVIVILCCLIGVASASVTYYYTINKKNQKFVASTYKLEEGEKTTAKGAISDLSDTLSTFAEIVDDQYVFQLYLILK